MPRSRSVTSSRPDQARTAPGLVIGIHAIELAFKRLKGLLGFGRLPAKGEALARSWPLAHLVFAPLIDDTAQDLLAVPPCTARSARELPSLSPWRVVQMLRDALLAAVRGALTVARLHGACALLVRRLHERPRRRCRQFARVRAGANA